MKHLLLLCLMIRIFLFQANAQNIVQLEYFFDTDPGFGNGTTVGITPAPNLANFNFTGNISSLSTGIHQLYVRSKDANNHWSVTNRMFFYKINASANSTGSLVTAMEYFFDTDPGFGNGTQVSVSPANNIANFAINGNISTLSSGIHQFYLRSKDNQGNWSITNRMFFYKFNSNSNNVASNITSMEYFFDTDPGFGNATAVSTSPSNDLANLSINGNIASLSSGIHQFYIRSKDNQGNWSITNRMFFYKFNSTNNSASANITSMEYFFDTDPGFGNATPVNVTASNDIVNFPINGNIATLNPGIHQFYIRSKDSLGQWSITNRLFFYKFNTSSTTLTDITKVEYFFDTDPGFGNGIDVPITPGQDIAAIDFTTNFGMLPLGPHQFYIRSMNADGIWSITNRMPVDKYQPFNVKLFLQGYYAGSGTMNNVMYNQGEEFLPGNHTDTIEVKLHESTYPYAVHSSIKTMLNTDGTAIAGASVDALGSMYYVSVNHRNSVETWSANPILIDSSSLYDFSLSANQAYGDNQIEVEPGVFAIYSGDINQDENVDLLDATVLENSINQFEFGYFSTDLNGDGNVDLLDSPVLEPNVSSFIFSAHP